MTRQPHQRSDSLPARAPSAAPRTDQPPRGPATPARPGAGGVPDQRALVLASLVLHPYPRDMRHVPRSAAALASDRAAATTIAAHPGRAAAPAGDVAPRCRAVVSATAARAPRADGALQQRHQVAVDDRRRLGRARLKRDLRGGRLTLAAVAARRPEPLRELPRIGRQRLERLNRHVIAARVNLARTLADAATATLRRLLAELDGAEPARLDAGTSMRLERGERDWRALALTLDRLICEHERSVRDEPHAAERWARADERLHGARPVRRQP